MHFCAWVALRVSMTKTAEWVSAPEGLTSGLHEREMSTLFTYQTLHKEKRTNKETQQDSTCLLTFKAAFVFRFTYIYIRK